jgi:hypothetical protein
MTDFVAYSSRPRQAMLCALCLVFVALGLVLAGVIGSLDLDEPTPVFIVAIGWVAVVVLGIFGLLWLTRMLGAREQLRVGPEGIRYAPWSPQCIPWHEVTGVTIWAGSRQRNILLHLRNPAGFPGKGVAGLLAGLTRRLSGGDVAISMAGTDRSFDEALAAIQQRQGPQ